MGWTMIDGIKTIFKKPCFLTVAFACLILCPAIRAEGAAINVPGDYATIQAAINAAANNDTIYIAAGSYAENISITGKSNLKIYGATNDATIIEPFDTTMVVINCLSCPFLRLESLTVRGSTAWVGGKGTIVLNDCGNFLIAHCIIGTQEFPGKVGIRLLNTGGYIDTCQLQYGQNGIEASSDCSFVNVSNCILHDYTANGIRLELGTQSGLVADVQDNEVYNSYLGISVSGPVALTGNNCHDNTYNYHIDSSSAAADPTNTCDGKPVYVFKNTSPSIPTNAGYVALYGCSNTTISDLVLSHNLTGIFLDHCTYITLDNITASSTGGASLGAVEIQYGHHNTINNSNLTGSETGLKVFESSSLTAMNNHITGNVFGVSIMSSNFAIISNNTISANGEGFSDYDSSGSSFLGNVISNNTFSGMTLDGTLSATVTGNTISGNTIFGLEISDSTGTYTANTIGGNGKNVNLFYTTNMAVNMNTSNTVDGQPIYWLRGASAATVPADAGLVVLGGCTNITVDGATLAHNSDGVLLLDSIGCTLSNLTLSDNDYGVELHGTSTGTIIEHCIVTNNLYAGIYLDGTDSIIRYNRIRDNKQWGIDLNYYYSGNNNQIYCNDLVGNAKPAGGGGNISKMLNGDIFQSPAPLNYIYKGQHLISILGNHYGDYSGIDANNDGIGDTNYGPSGRGVYPLMFDPTTEETPIPGDVSGDFVIDLADAIAALNTAAGLTVSGIQIGADVNGDGRIGTEETIFCLERVAGLR